MGSYMWQSIYNYGHWTATVLVNGQQRDTKNQFYPPHASLPASAVPPGSIVTIIVGHLFFQWFVSPVYYPDVGWRFRAYWGPAFASGTLSCIVPLREQ